MRYRVIYTNPATKVTLRLPEAGDPADDGLDMALAIEGKGGITVLPGVALTTLAWWIANPNAPFPTEGRAP